MGMSYACHSRISSKKKNKNQETRGGGMLIGRLAA
jgi:hypothetical protein